jgi:hypothetical protein
MNRIISLIVCTGFCLTLKSQLYIPENGLSESGTGTSKKVLLGGTLNNSGTTIDFGSSNSSSNFLFKKGTSNYFFIGNDGKIGIGTSTPSFKLDVNGDIRVNTLIIGKGTGSYTDYNVALGDYVLQNNTTGTINTGVGSRVLLLNTTGSYNTGVGANALLYNTSGSHNTAVGYRTLESNTTGGANTAVGYNAMPSNTTGDYNSAFGVNALSNNTTGTGNTAVGDIALGTNNTGSGNTSIGYWSLFYNTTGSGNSAHGGTAMTYNTTGSNNSALGGAALYLNTTGSSNASVGYYALFNNTTGNYNTAVGDNAGSSLTSGNSNIFIGRNVQPNISTTGSNQLNIGNWIYGDNGNIGIGMSTPTSSRLSVSGTGGYPARFRDEAYGVAYIQVENSNGYYANFGVEGGGVVSLKSNNTTFLYGNAAGKVGIGTTNLADNNYKLFVETGIRTRKIKVDQATWPDYVFHQTYELMPLGEVEKFIQQHNHLPAVPSAKQIEENGLDLGDNQSILLKKIEELTLYIIDQNKKIEQLQKKVDSIMTNKN